MVIKAIEDYIKLPGNIPQDLYRFLCSPNTFKGFVERLNCTYKNKTYQITYSGQTIPVDKPIDQAFLSSNLGKYCISQKTGYVFDIRFSASASHSKNKEKGRHACQRISSIF